MELSSKGGQALSATGRVDMSEGTVAEASGSFGGLMLLMGHLAIDGAAAVGLFVVAVGGVAGEVGVGVSGHGDGEEIFERPGAVEVEVRTIGGLNCSTLRVRRGKEEGRGGLHVVFQRNRSCRIDAGSILPAASVLKRREDAGQSG